MDPAWIAQAEALLGHTFADTTLLVNALTHPSYSAEHPEVDSYDRLEFLGDAVLGFVVAEYAYREFPHAREGDLTRRKAHVVAREALAEAAEAMGIGPFVLVGLGASAAGERERASVLENTLEALIAAVYLDAGLEHARAFVVRVLGPRLREDRLPQVDAKGALQQWTQAERGALPAYRVVGTTGPVHRRTFTVEVVIDGRVAGVGEGRSKQAAEKAAAEEALLALRSAEDGG